MFLSSKAREQKRESLRRAYEPDPGFWVKFRDEKFHGDANTVAIAGHEDDNRCVFAFPGEIKSLQSYPDGVRVLDGFGNTYFIYPTSEEITSCWIRIMDEQEMYQRDHQWREFNEIINGGSSMATPKKLEFNVSVAIKAWIDVLIKADSLEDALRQGHNIKLDKAFDAAQNGCMDGKIKVTGVYALEDWEK